MEPTRRIDVYPRPNPQPTWGWSTIDPGEVLRTWGSVIPPERIHVLPMRMPGAGPEDLWFRFLDVLGLSADGLAPQPSGANESLGIVEVEVLRRVNRQLREVDGFLSPIDRGRWIRGYLAQGTIRGLGENEKFRPGDDKLAELQAREQEWISLLATGSFDLRGDVEHVRSADVSDRRHPGQVTNDEVMTLSAKVIAQLMTDIRQAATDGGPPSD